MNFRWMSIGTIVLISIAVIFYNFNKIPAQLTRDEIEFVNLTLSLSDVPYKAYSELATGHSTTYFYTILASFKAFGLNQFALRLPSAIFGLLSGVLGFVVLNKALSYVYSDQIKVMWLSLAGGLLFVTSRWFYSFPRYAFEASFLMFLELCSLLLLLLWLEKKRNYQLVLSGIFAGVAYTSYLTGRIFFLLPLIIVIGYVIKNKKKLSVQKIALTLCTYLIPFVLVTTPLNAYLFMHQDIRIQQQSYWQNTDLSFGEKLSFLEQNVVNTPAMIFVPGKGDAIGLHNYPKKPAFNVISFGFLCLGLIAAYKKRKSKAKNVMYVCLTYVAIATGPTLLTYPWDNPNMLRTYTVLVPLMMFWALGVGFFLEVVKKLIQRKYAQSLVLFVTFLLISASAAYDARTYFVHQKEVFKNAFEIKDGFASVDEKYKENFLK